MSGHHNRWVGWIVAVLLGWFLETSAVHAEPHLFEVTAEVSSSDIATAPAGGALTLQLGWDPDQLSLQVGGDHYPLAGSAPLQIRTPAGFELALDSQVVSVQPGSPDGLTAQSFVSDLPNDWHIQVDFLAFGWLMGSNELPQAFPTSFESAYITVWFTDEFEWIRSLEAQVVEVRSLEQVSPLEVPLGGGFARWLLIAALAWVGLAAVRA